jgi:hypothetical protein
MLVPGTLKKPIVSTQPDEISISIIRALLYFGIFDYPIKKEELFQYVTINNKIEVQTALARLIGNGMVDAKDDFIWIDRQPGIVEDRLTGNKRAAKFLRIARRQAWFLSKFPFIKCICVSGSLSKHYMDDHSDIDYFIIAKNNMLWLTKLLMSAIVETLEVLRLEKYFCPNYIITENNLLITDRNVYTAMEIATLIPLYNKQEYERFLAENSWIKHYFPHYRMNLPEKTFGYKKHFLKKVWDNEFFSWLDKKLFQFYKNRFMYKVRKGKIVAFDNDMVITQNDFKLHLSGHRKRILQKFENNIQQFEERYDVML